MNSKSIYQTSADLTGGNHIKQLALISAGVTVAASLLITLVEYVIGFLLEDATGLAMLGKRTALLTFQSLFSFAITLALPFWQYGFIRVAMYTARKASPEYKTLLWGFRRFGPLLRLMLLEILIALGWVLLCSWLSSMAYMMTPWAARIVEQITPMLAEAEKLTSDPAALNAMMEPLMMQIIESFWPLYLLVLVTLCAVLIPWLYKLRLAPYHIMDGENSALAAMEKSKQEMYGNRFAMFKLDLRFWWYYALHTLALLPTMLYSYGVIGGGEVTMWICYLGSLGLQLLVEWQLLSRVQTAYALAYDELKPHE